MYCCNCGRKLEDEARYCSVCGTARPPIRPPNEESRDRLQLSRVRAGKKLAGVCGGVARYFDMDVTLVRIVWILVTIFPPLPGVIAYIVCWIVMPQDPLPWSVTPRPSSATSQILST